MYIYLKVKIIVCQINSYLKILLFHFTASCNHTLTSCFININCYRLSAKKGKIVCPCLAKETEEEHRESDNTWEPTGTSPQEVAHSPTTAS